MVRVGLMNGVKVRLGVQEGVRVTVGVGVFGIVPVIVGMAVRVIMAAVSDKSGVGVVVPLARTIYCPAVRPFPGNNRK